MQRLVRSAAGEVFERIASRWAVKLGRPAAEIIREERELRGAVS